MPSYLRFVIQINALYEELIRRDISKEGRKVIIRQLNKIINILN